MANSIKFMNEGFNKYNNIKPSFEDCLYEAMKTLTERQQEWSDEDKKDNELLWSIFDKRQERSNAKLTPEEQAVLKKYNIEEPYNYILGNRYGGKRVVARTSPNTNLFDNEVQSRQGYRTKYSTKVNLADRARKQGARYLAQRDIDKFSKDSHIRVDNMKRELNSRKSFNDKLSNIDKEYDAKIKRLENERDSKKDVYFDTVKDSQSRIDKLLKRESLKNEAYSEEQIKSWKNDFGKVTTALAQVYFEVNTDEAQYFVKELYDKTLEKVKSFVNQDK